MYNNVNNITIEITDPEYTILSSENTTSQYPVNSASFVVVWDLDGDSLDDNIEIYLAQKFSPVLHKHSWDYQQGLSNVDWILTGRSTLKAYNILGQVVYSSTISSPDQIHVHLGSGDRDSFGRGEMWTFWKFDIIDNYQHQSAPAGQRPLYYHVYKDGNCYYVQYWYFFNMNDIVDQTVNNTWHEGDFEHVSLKVNMAYDPIAVNFYRHDGGRTIEIEDCWWSPTNNTSYSGLQRDYNSNRTHLHIWVAANSHASYNRNDLVYHVTAEAAVDFCTQLDPENYYDNVDYDPSGYDLYFDYDYLENLGEYEQSPLQQASNGNYYPYAHGYFWLEHNMPRKFSKDWLTFVGGFGESWIGNCWVLINGGLSTDSPVSPVYEDKNHEWKNFTENYSFNGFGNENEDKSVMGVTFVYVTKTFEPDFPDGD